MVCTGGKVMRGDGLIMNWNNNRFSHTVIKMNSINTGHVVDSSAARYRVH